MPTTFIASTPRSSLEALRFQGISVSESYAQLQSMLRKNLSPDHALFFAEPVMNSNGTSVDWYTPLDGNIVPLASLPPEEQQAAFQEIRRIAGDINELAESLKQGGGPSQSMRGNILSLALTYPGAEYVYMAGRQPLLLGWGFSPASLAAQPEELIRFGAAAAAPPPPPSAVPAPEPVAVPAGKSNWLRLLLSLLGGLLLILALFFLAGLLFGYSGCPVAGLPWGEGASGCSAYQGGDKPGDGSQQPTPAAVPPEVVSALTAEQEKERSLRRRIEDLRCQLTLRIDECPRPRIAEPEVEPPKVEPPKPEPEPEPEAPPSLADIMPTTPEAPPPPSRRVAKGDTLEIPPGAREKNDLSFLEGCWLCETGLYSSATGEPVVVRYCFDARGRGNRNIKEKKTGDNCKGPVTAQFDSSGQLRIRAQDAKCSRRGAYVPQTVNCSQKGKKAECYGREDSRNRTRWRATFRRI